MTIDRPTRRAIGTVIAVVLASLALDRLLGPFRVGTRDDEIAWEAGDVVALPTPRDGDDVSVEGAIADRRSRREYADAPLELSELGQLCWAAQGITDQGTDARAAPSAGALYPLELYVVVGEPGVTGLKSGVYRYRPATHDLARGENDVSQSDLKEAAVDQDHVEDAPVDLVIAAVDTRTTGTYGQRGRSRYVPMEAGHASENVYLQAEALGLATVTVGAFADDRVLDVLGADPDQRPLYILPVGHRP
ncbi:MAG: SagB/ThcOx family dehydrogenase [Haloarculaceae archaeon]